ncbi:hypothetical protein [Ferrimonas balearica]|uniref:hypothetical protein n=1 Tax=Ferrimonas balearica TaxID=44012 RepID=UPI001C99FF08|nr:hypothetical protein [Ferrimonas balearica]MBY5991910.1 hypothetical protein [Ferrimonas balearica]
MTQTRKLVWFGALLVALLVAYALIPMPQQGDVNPRKQGALRAQVHQQSEVLGTGLAYYRSSNTPAPTGSAAAPVDINVLIEDFPTAAGAIHQQVLADQQYRAALEGDQDQAMKLMAESFLTGEGSGSYQERW